MYKHIIEKNLHIIERLFNNKQIGICNFMFQNNVCYINNIEINQNYRNKKFGTGLLKKVEEYAKNNNIKHIQVNIRQKPLDDLIDFYIKNNYSQSKSNSITQQYDDGIDIYDLIIMEKKIMEKKII